MTTVSRILRVSSFAVWPLLVRASNLPLKRTTVSRLMCIVACCGRASIVSKAHLLLDDDDEDGVDDDDDDDDSWDLGLPLGVQVEDDHDHHDD